MFLPPLNIEEDRNRDLGTTNFIIYGGNQIVKPELNTRRFKNILFWRHIMCGTQKQTPIVPLTHNARKSITLSMQGKNNARE